MTYRSPIEKKQRRFVRLRTVGMVLVGFIIFSILDYPLSRLFFTGPDRSIEQHDWYRMLRVVGFMGTWAVVGIVFFVHDRNRIRGLSVFLSALVSGAIAELLKLVFARERPVDGNTLQDGLYHFRAPFSGFVDGSNLGLPSSHAAVAFGGCFMLAAMIPNTRRVLIILAIGCGVTRMLTGAHFSTDVYLGAIVGWCVSIWISRLIPRSEPKFMLSC